MDTQDLTWRADAVEALADLRAEFLATRGTESVSLDAIPGRVLAADVVADTDAPPHSHATMDGYAFDARGEYPFHIRAEEVFPEDEPPALAPGEAAPVATGGRLPGGANAVVKREDTRVEGDDLYGPDVDPGTYVYRQGSNWEAGETLFAAGERLGPKDAILLRDLGHESVPVRERLSVGVAATGTEIHDGTSTDLDSRMLEGLVASWGHDATYEGSAPDDEAAVRDLVLDAAADHDVVVTTGGTSVGHKDYVVSVLRDLGDVLFHGVRVRPGKPIAVASLPDQDAVAVAIPGKPVGAHTIAVLVARTFFTGETRLPSVPAALSVDVALGPDGFEYAIPVTLDGDTAHPLGHESSPLKVYEDTYDPSVLSSSTRATRADGFVLTTEDLEGGETVQVVPYDAVE